MIISIGEKKAFHKLQHPFMIKTFSKVGTEGAFLNIINTYSQHHTQWAKAKNFPTKIRNKTRCPFSPLLFNIVLEVLAIAIRQEKEIKGIQIGKEEMELSLLADDMIVYMENPVDSTKNIFDLIN